MKICHTDMTRHTYLNPLCGNIFNVIASPCSSKESTKAVGSFLGHLNSVMDNALLGFPCEGRNEC